MLKFAMAAVQQFSITNTQNFVMVHLREVSRIRSRAYS
jgi:hypothetical protein